MHPTDVNAYANDTLQTLAPSLAHYIHNQMNFHYYTNYVK